MNKKTYLRRSVVAVGLAVATLMAMAGPAGAIHQASFTTGILNSTKTGVSETFNLNPTTASCTTAGLAADLGTTSATTSSAVSVTALNSSHVTTFSNGPFLVVLTRSTTGNSNGHWTSGSSTTSPHNFDSSRIAIVITIYNTTSCTPTGTPVCTVAAILHLAGYTTSISTSTNFVLTVVASVGTVVAFPTCAAGPSQILGTTITNTGDVTGHFTSNT